MLILAVDGTVVIVDRVEMHENDYLRRENMNVNKQFQINPG